VTTVAAGGAIAIIFAGGVGSRMAHGSVPKQFIEVAGKAVLVHTLEHFQRHPEVRAVYIACLSAYVAHAWDLIRQFGLDKVRVITPGGETAQHSILNALRGAVADGAPEEAAALVHDGVRPIISSDLISRNIAAAERHGSAVTAIPCFETIAMSLDGAETVSSVTQRDLMYVLQAPQTFRLGDAYRVNMQSLTDGLLGKFVDQAHLMRHYGKALHMVPGLRGNVKLTTDFDLMQFKLLAGSGVLASVIDGRLS
jgi:2-C-methyl-D-erythritol 4-phosphate cytidylyltransferase